MIVRIAFISLLLAALAAGAAGPEMVRLPGGMFTMGCSPGDADCGKDEKPPHRVAVGAFWMDVTPVTVAQYQAVMGDNPLHIPGCPNCPVDTVSWTDAQAYCAKVGKRLPTEAEWEYAARGGTTGPRYGELDAIAWVSRNAGDKTHAVAQKQPNAYGLYDMVGNVCEWCADWYDATYYAASRADNPPGPLSGAHRVLRGASWIDYPPGARASRRAGAVPDFRGRDNGFRCARD
jgi:formylglycine-generating enzyme required for sulfatase activity